MQTTRTDRLAESMTDGAGIARLAIRLGGDELGWVEVVEDTGWDEDSEGWRYVVGDDDDSNETDDYDEARYLLAQFIRDRRSAAMDERRERDEDSAREFVDGLIERGKVSDVLKALRVAGLI